MFWTPKVTPLKESLNKAFDKLIPFVLDCMDAGGRATHGAVAESLSKHEWKQLVQRLINKAQNHNYAGVQNMFWTTKATPINNRNH